MPMERVDALIELERWPEALTALSTELADPSADAGAWCRMAQIRLGLGEPDRAIDAAARAVALAPDDDWGYRLLALAYTRADRLPEAERAARRAAELAPDQPQALLVLTDTLRFRGDYDGAEQVALINLRANPQSAMPWEAATRVALARQQWERAEDLARSGLALAPEQDHLMLLLSEAEVKQGRVSDAAAHATAAIRARPDNPEGRRQLQRILAPAAIGGAGIGFLVIAQVIRVALTEGAKTLPAVAQTVITAFGGLVIVGLIVFFTVHYLQQRQLTRALEPQLQAMQRRARQTQRRPRLLISGWLFALVAVLTIEAPLLAVFFGVLAAALLIYTYRLPKTAT